MFRIYFNVELLTEAKKEFIKIRQKHKISIDDILKNSYGGFTIKDANKFEQNPYYYNHNVFNAYRLLLSSYNQEFFKMVMRRGFIVTILRKENKKYESKTNPGLV